METFPISANLLNGIIGYLGKRPYEEVFQMIQALQAEVAKSAKPPVDQPPTE